MILSPTQVWRNCFVASLPRLCNCAIRKNALRTSSGNFKRNLQNTQTAPLAAVCTPTLKFGHRTTNKKKNLPESLSDSLLSLSLCLCLIEFCYAILCVCQNSVTLLCENVPQWVKTWVSVFSVYLSQRGVHLYLGRAPLRWWHVEACNSHLTVHVPLPEGL